MEELYKKYPEKIKAIGVSNVSVPWLKLLLEKATVVPAVNQVELHPYVFMYTTFQDAHSNQHA